MRAGQALATRAASHRTCPLRGMSNKLVGRKLGLSRRTVEDYRASAMKKLAVKGKVELTRLVASSY